MNLNIGRGNYLVKGKPQHVNMTDLDHALLAKNPTTEGRPLKPIHMLVFYNGNPVAVSPNVNKVIENLKRDDLFVVGFDMIMTDSMEYCDLVLPASTQFETDDVIGDYHCWYVQICEKVIEPLGESKPNWDFFSEYGRRMGFTEQAFRDTPLDMIRQFLDADTPYYKGITLERLQKEKFIHLDLGSSVPVRSGGKCGTPSGKIELYSEIMKKAGFDPVIDLRTCEEEMTEVDRTLPFRMLSPGIPQRVNSSFYNVKYIRAFTAYECEINPVDAKKLGIKMGDRVRLTNQRGEAFFVARVTTRVAPGVVRTAKCNWRSTNPYGRGTNTNTLTTSKLTDMGGCSAYHSTRVNVQKARSGEINHGKQTAKRLHLPSGKLRGLRRLPGGLSDSQRTSRRRALPQGRQLRSHRRERPCARRLVLTQLHALLEPVLHGGVPGQRLHPAPRRHRRP